jgi:cholesterol transport system auxiliary component
MMSFACFPSFHLRRLQAGAAAAAALLLLGACSALPERPQRPVTYDFGPGVITAPAAAGKPLPALALAEVEPSGLLEGSTAVLYRLAYADAQQLQPYAQARWSTPAAQLVRQRLRETLGQRRAVFSAGESAALMRTNGTLPRILRVDLEEFSQIFDSPGSSAGVVRLRVTLLDSTPEGDRLLGQRLVVVQRPAASADAAGGVRALAQAADAAAQEIEDWLEKNGY